MRFQKTFDLADKFAQTRLHDFNENANDGSAFFAEFTKKLGSILNEMLGDIMTLRVKDFDHRSLKMIHDLYAKTHSVFNKINDDYPLEGIYQVILYVLNDTTITQIQLLNGRIQKFLKENEVVFSPSSRFSQPKIESLKSLIHLAENGKKFILTNPQITDKPSVKVKNPTKFELAETIPFDPKSDVKTKIEK
jgi:hypothetical protein